MKVPTPQYIVFYNGDKKMEDIKKFRLSDAFLIPDKSGDFEWTATFTEGMQNIDAIQESIEWAIKENLLDGFFKLQKAPLQRQRGFSYSWMF